jgi:hypothetical protein
LRAETREHAALRVPPSEIVLSAAGD